MVARYIGGSAAARLIGVSRPTLYTWHGKKLHPKKNDIGNWVYDRQEVLEFAKWYQKTRPRYRFLAMDEGMKAAKAFQDFDAGFTVSQVVTRVQLSPEIIEKWYDIWQRDARNLPVEVERTVDLEIKKTSLQIKREELAAKRAGRLDAERRISKREQREYERDRARKESAPENQLPDIPKRENTPLHEMFEQASGVKKAQ